MVRHGRCRFLRGSYWWYVPLQTKPPFGGSTRSKWPLFIWAMTTHVGGVFFAGLAGATRLLALNVSILRRAASTSARLAFGPAACIAWNSRRPSAQEYVAKRS